MIFLMSEGTNLIRFILIDKFPSKCMGTPQIHSKLGLFQFSKQYSPNSSFSSKFKDLSLAYRVSKFFKLVRGLLLEDSTFESQRKIKIVN